MGCDIHMYVEYCNDLEKPYWLSIGKVHPGRNYSMFEAMAGVRGNLPGIVQPKGLPKDLAYDAENDFYLRVNDKYEEQEGYCSSENADRWVKNGSSIDKFYGQNGEYRKVTHPDWHTPSWLTAQEYDAAISLAEERLVHWFKREQPKTATWLKTMKQAAESTGTEEAIKNYQRLESLYNQPEKIDVTYKAINAMMKLLPNARLVFWFDN